MIRSDVKDLVSFMLDLSKRHAKRNPIFLSLKMISSTIPQVLSTHARANHPFSLWKITGIHVLNWAESNPTFLDVLSIVQALPIKV